MSGLASSCAQGSDVASLRTEVAALRAEVAELRAELRGAPGTSPRRADAASSRQPSAPAELSASDAAAAPSTCTWTFLVEPEGATVTVDGVAVEGTWHGPLGETRKHVRVARGGYRTVEQSVMPDRDRTLRYVLLRGRGLSQLAPL